VFWCSLVGFAQAEPPDEKVTVPETNVVPYLAFVPEHRVGDPSDGLNSFGSNTAVVLPYTLLPNSMPPNGSLAIENPADRDPASNSTVVMLDEKVVTFSPMFLIFAVVLGGLAGLAWWRKQKREKLKRSVRRLVREIEQEWVRYGSYEERVR
jgi:hypothetical protein